MNKKAQKLIAGFYNDVWIYMQNEYKPKWARLYNSEDLLDDMIYLTGEYYLGGNTVPFTAGQIVDLLRSKYGNRKPKRKDI
jgi:hypothetical protein